MTDTSAPGLPAEQATGLAGYVASRLNATRHGVLSRFVVLPWEDAREFEALHATLITEHAPSGAVEAHLIEELAGVLWRKRRLRLAEAAAHKRALNDALSMSDRVVKAAVAHLPSRQDRERAEQAFRSTEADTTLELADIAEDEAMTCRALAILNSRRNDAYEAALDELRCDSREWWGRELARKPDDFDPGEQPYAADTGSLKRFIETEIMPWYCEKRRDLDERPLIQAQAVGESLDPDRLEKLGRYEVHLDRKLERTLSTLIRLQELRKVRFEAAVS